MEGKGYITSYTNTWRGIYTGGTSRVGTGTGTKAINFVAGSNVTVSYEAAGTGSGQSGSADYFNVKIAATDTKYTNGTGISLSGTTFSLDVAGAKTALGLGTMAYETASNYLTTTTASSTYVKLSPGTSEQTISSSISSFVKGVINLWRSSGDHYTFLGFSNGTTETYLGGIGFKSQSDHNVYHKDGSNYYTIWDASNSGISTMPWACSTLSVNTSLTLPNNVSILGTLTDSTTASMIKMSTANNVVIGNTSFAYNVNLCGTNVNFYAGGTTRAAVVTSDGILPGTKLHSCGIATAYWGSIYGKDLYLGGDTHGTAAGSIIFYERLDSQRNGFKIAPYHATTGDRINLDFYSSNVSSSPYAPSWKRVLRLTYAGNVYMGEDETNGSDLTVYGSITSSTGQFISSDATKKKNWRDLKYGVEDIAKATAGVFDWKDGKGEDAGTKAQDWMYLVPQLVHG